MSCKYMSQRIGCRHYAYIYPFLIVIILFIVIHAPLYCLQRLFSLTKNMQNAPFDIFPGDLDIVKQHPNRAWE